MKPHLGLAALLLAGCATFPKVTDVKKYSGIIVDKEDTTKCYTPNHEHWSRVETDLKGRGDRYKPLNYFYDSEINSAAQIGLPLDVYGHIVTDRIFLFKFKRFEIDSVNYTGKTPKKKMIVNNQSKIYK